MPRSVAPLLTAVCLLAFAAPAAAQQAPAFQRDSLYAGLRGSWRGTLTYRDYSNDKIVILPTSVVIAATTDSTLTLDYTYDDGPGKLIRSRDVLTVLPAAGTWQTQSEKDAPEAAKIAEVEGFRTGRTGRLVYGSSVTENDLPAESRNTLTVTATDVVLRHETRRAGGVFTMRNELRVVRE